jgi:organic hydroperoxide reductase OsmC/OhrA
MSEHRVRVRWQRTTPGFGYDEYDRTHAWEFGGGARLSASSAPEFRGRADLPNPEEALVAALSSCHMLTFLALAARKRFVVDSYDDDAVGTMSKNADGKLAVTRTVLRPRVDFGGERKPSREELAKLHERAHEECFIANSVKTEVVVEPVEA